MSSTRRATAFRFWCTVFGLSLIAMLTTGTLTFGQGNCLQDEFAAAGNTQKLNCTAGDVRVAQVTNVRDLNGNPLSTCIEGSTFSFVADFTIITTANATNAGGRDNIGLYFATQNQPTALTGTCVDNIISPLHQCSGVPATINCGTAGYQEFDPAPDNCGDTSSSINPNIIDTIVVTNFLCKAPAGSTTLVLPNCTSWQVPGQQIQCVSPAPNFPYEIAAIPGTPSKCNCATIPLPITIVTPAVTVAKSCNTALSPGTGLTSCDAGEDGSTVTYHVAITNTSPSGGSNITVDQICDSAYGNILTSNTFTGLACPAGRAGSITGTNCSALDIANGATGTCDFTAFQGAPSVGTFTVTNTVKVSGHADILASKTFGPTQSNSVTVVSHESPSTATVTKGTVRTTHACVTVRYSVDVSNTSGADENLTLSAFNDSAFGSITTVHGDVLGTTCGVASTSPGLGTASDLSGGGVLPASLPVGGADYKCNFDGHFCSDLPAGTTCFSHTNKVTATISDDSSEGNPVTETGNTLTAQECITLTPTSTTP